MKLSDYVTEFLVKLGIKNIFGISGGAIIHLFDSVARHPDIQYICTQHEEALAMAVDGYARISDNIAAGMVTSGPGGTNLLTGVCCSFFDSIPAIFITGQVATSRLKQTPNIRQMGFQETDIVSIYQSVTKYCVLIRNPEDIRYHLEKAVYLAQNGRPGPVLIDLPDDLQRTEIDPDSLKSFKPLEDQKTNANCDIDEKVLSCLGLIKNAKRPVIIFGAGVAIAKAQNKIKKLAAKLGIPFLLTWGAKDIWENSHQMNIGGIGVAGPRYGNLAVQNSDLIIAIGTRLSQMITGGKLEYFGREAKKVIVDIDIEEIEKFKGKGIKIDLAIQSEIHSFVDSFDSQLGVYEQPDYAEWLNQIDRWKTSFPLVSSKDFESKKEVDAYIFVDALSDECKEGSIILTDAGGNLTWVMQAFKVKKGQRLFSAWNHSPMGYSLAAACGASFVDKSKDVICVIGDGGLQMCIEELATIARHQLPIKIFLFNNHGHGIQKNTLNTWLDGRYEAVDYDSGLYFPDFNKVAAAYDIKAVNIDTHKNLNSKIKEVLVNPGPIFCNVEINPEQKIEPFLTFGRPLEDLGPLLDRKTFYENMIIDPIKEASGVLVEGSIGD
jgi:acetolactate synthase I/II/III large subunit